MEINNRLLLQAEKTIRECLVREYALLESGNLNTPLNPSYMMDNGKNRRGTEKVVSQGGIPPLPFLTHQTPMEINNRLLVLTEKTISELLTRRVIYKCLVREYALLENKNSNTPLNSSYMQVNSSYMQGGILPLPLLTHQTPKQTPPPISGGNI